MKRKKFFFIILLIVLFVLFCILIFTVTKNGFPNKDKTSQDNNDTENYGYNDELMAQEYTEDNSETVTETETMGNSELIENYLNQGGLKTPQDLDTQSQEYYDANKVYMDFLGNKRTVAYNGKDYGIEELINEDNHGGVYKYALFDTNGDEIPDLHLRVGSRYLILSCDGDDLFLLKELSPYDAQLDNRGILQTPSADNEEKIESYAYKVVDYNGSTIVYLPFERKDEDRNGIYDENDKYYFDDVEVSMEEWQNLTRKYFEMDNIGINWITKVYTGENG